jgi:hypothetical protein
MGKIEDYRKQLQELNAADWDAFLLAESGLPGPRGNIELARAVALEGDAARFDRYLAIDAGQAPANTPGEFLAFCGVLGLGRLVAAGERPLSALRELANDPRWRTREAVAMALQTVGGDDINKLEALQTWAEGTYLEQRAAAAGLCEPDLLSSVQACSMALQLLDKVTGNLQGAYDRKVEAFRALRKGMAYCWSVAVASCPEEGKPRFEYWLESSDRDVRWIMGENLKKKRLQRLDGAWVTLCQEKLAASNLDK